MIVRYWHPFQEVETLRRQLDQVFNEVSNVVENVPTTLTPAMRLVETAEAYVLTIQLAGLNPDDINIEVTREAVTVAGDRARPETAEGDRVLHDGLAYGTLRRVINLPKPIQNDAAEATFTNGMLTLTLPKVEEVRNKVVKVSLGQAQAAPEAAPETAAE